MADPKHEAKLLAGAKVWNAWRKKHAVERFDRIRADLIGADLNGANLSGADLSRVDLSGADLSGVDLSGADLSDAKLSGTYLNRAKLDGAKLNGTDLSRANLSGANLGRAYLNGADLSHARLSEARFFRSALNNLDLSTTSGLHRSIHQGPSWIDYWTLRKSGRLPLQFLRGCGLSDKFIDYMPSIFDGSPIEHYSTFISYSTGDQEFAERLHEGLQNKGVRCWFAPEDMKIGDRVRDTIDQKIRLHDKLLLILSETSIDSDWVEHEVERALDEEERRGELVLFPIRIDDAVMETKFGWAKRLREAHKPTGRHIGDFTGWKDHDAYKKAFDRLLRDLKVEGAGG